MITKGLQTGSSAHPSNPNTRQLLKLPGKCYIVIVIPATVRHRTEFPPFSTAGTEKSFSVAHPSNECKARAVIGETVSHYNILEKLGEGGMGVVYKAYDTKLLRPVALKFLTPALTRDEEAKKRFIREARAASALDHPNIAVVHDIDETPDGASFICMAYYEGQTLKALLSREPLGVAESLRIVVQIASGLQRAHESGIIHRDIKPGNIIVTPQGNVKIVDFGLAKLSAQSLITQSRSVGGTAAYMAPEQILGSEVDGRSDLFSLGIVFYECVTGQRPFVGEHEPALFYSIVNSEPIPPSTLQPDVTPALERIMLRLLAKDPAQRYQTAADLYADVGSITGQDLTPIPMKRSVPVFRSRPVAIGASLALIIATAAIWFLTAKPALSFSPKDYALVAAFENTTGESVFDHSLTEAMKVSLRQSGRINLLPDSRIGEVLERMKSNKKMPLDEVTALEVARREGARIVLSGTISRLGAGYFLTCKIIDAVNGETVKLFHHQSDSAKQILSHLDDLCAETRAALGESIRDISQYSIPLDKVTTQSLEALELFSRGNILEGQGDYRNAALLKEQAVLKDSLFVMAISDLSYLNRSKLGNDSLAFAYHRRVLPLVDRVNDRERFYILALYYGPTFEYDFPKAFEYAQQLVVRYPNGAEGLALLAWLAMQKGDVSTCIMANERSMAADSTYASTCYNNSGFALALNGMPDEAIDLFNRSKARRPGFIMTDEYRARSFWMKTSLDSAQHIFQSIKSTRSLASLRLFEGRLDSAARQFLAALPLAVKPVQRASLLHVLAHIERARGNTRSSDNYLAEAVAKCLPTDEEFTFLATTFALLGRQREAKSMARKIEATVNDDPYFQKRRNEYVDIINGLIDLSDRKCKPAISHLNQIRRLQAGDILYLLAQRYLGDCYACDMDTTALTYYTKVLEERGKTLMAPRQIGDYPVILWSETELSLARFQLSRGKKSEARSSLERLSDRWSHADTDYAPSREVRHLLAESSH